MENEVFFRVRRISRILEDLGDIIVDSEFIRQEIEMRRGLLISNFADETVIDRKTFNILKKPNIFQSIVLCYSSEKCRDYLQALGEISVILEKKNNSIKGNLNTVIALPENLIFLLGIDRNVFEPKIIFTIDPQGNMLTRRARHITANLKSFKKIRLEYLQDFIARYEVNHSGVYCIYLTCESPSFASIEHLNKIFCVESWLYADGKHMITKFGK